MRRGVARENVRYTLPPMSDENPVSAESEWSRSRSFDDLCELAARFIEGNLCFFPGWLPGEIDEETDALIESLATLNRNGFLTLASQPGLPPSPAHDGSERQQRAFVTGFALGRVAAAIEALGAKSELVVHAFSADEFGGEAEPVAMRGGEPYLFTGHAAGPDELGLFQDLVGESALAELVETRYLTVHDPEWGRRGHLWPLLVAAVTHTSPPVT